MEITQFIASHREALLIGDYNAYRAQLTRQLLATRRRLHRVTPKKEKFTPKPITADDVGSNHEFAHLLLLLAERAWAVALHMKTSHAENNTTITGSTRSHIISRLNKGAKTAATLVQLLQEPSAKATEIDLLEARAYHATLAGAEHFEKQSQGQHLYDGEGSEKRWQTCLQQYSTARVIYAALLAHEQKEVYRDFLANTIDPTIRYAAYQARISRTIAIPTVAQRFFPKDDTPILTLVQTIDPNALKETPTPQPQTSDPQHPTPQAVPNSVSWRGRKANIVDASIGQSLASVASAASQLRTYLSSNPSASAKDKAAAYDDILIASQDAADATKRATDELEKERVDESDPRMQDLRVTSLSVNYDLISWRIGRNRILIGADDGLSPDAPALMKPAKRSRKNGSAAAAAAKEEPKPRRVMRLKERVVLYDAILQSIASIKDLRGALRDTNFVQELDSQTAYFRALKCLNISYSHTLLGNHLNALALLNRAAALLPPPPKPTPVSTHASTSSAPPTLSLSPHSLTSLSTHLSTTLTRTHALVALHALQNNSTLAAQKNLAATAVPWIQRLNDYPSPGVQVDLENLVKFPPGIEPVPVKPLFLDVAFNYIDYPGRGGVTNGLLGAAKGLVGNVVGEGEGVEAKQQQKKGWFGFGR